MGRAFSKRALAVVVVAGVFGAGPMQPSSAMAQSAKGSSSNASNGSKASPSKSSGGQKNKPPPPTKSTSKGAERKSGGSDRGQDTTIRRSVAGGPTFDDAAMGADTPELRALYAAERELFPPASASIGTPWPDELPFPVGAAADRPRVHASGLPPSPLESPMLAEGGKDLSWLSKLELPDLPVRWDARVVRYLEFFKDDPRGRSTLTTWLRRSGRYRESIRKVLRRKGLPEDLTWLAMIESGFDPTARSPVGAVGLWQFMPETGKIYGLSLDRWMDQRMSLGLATEAAADFLADLYRRFGSWDLAMASYNMGYGGVLSAVRKYNTNDFWALCKLEGSIPWETTLYVPKILAAAIVSRNLQTFGFQDVSVDAPLDGDEVRVAGGTALATVATACGSTVREIEQLNPELRASRTPPGEGDVAVKVPRGQSACAQNLSKVRHEGPVLERYVVRFGESLEQIAQARRVTVQKLVELNAIAQGEVVRGGTVLIVPKGEGDVPKDANGDKQAAKSLPAVVVPPDMFVYPDRKRVFYRVLMGDTVRDVAQVFKVSADELRRWNGFDPTARLVEGMTLQLFVPRDADLSGTLVLGEDDVRTITPGTDEFFQHWDDKGRRRVVVNAKAGDTLESIGKKYGVTVALMERINRRGRGDVLSEGDAVVVWTPGSAAGKATGALTGTASSTSSRLPDVAPERTPPLAAPPNPELLPALP